VSGHWSESILVPGDGPVSHVYMTQWSHNESPAGKEQQAADVFQN
jgi:hypothetical protein